MGRSIEIGDTTYEIQRFSTFKAITAGDVLNEILEAVPDFSERVAKFTRQYREENTLKLNRATAELRYPPEEIAMISDEGWAASGGYIEIPASPGTLDVLAHVFPFVFSVARERVLKLVALIVIPNADLREADEADRVDEEIARMAKRLVHEDVSAVLDLAIEAGEVLSEQFEGKAAGVRKLGAMFGFQTGSPTESEEELTTSSSPTSTASESPTAGAEPTPSTEPRSETPSPTSISS